MKEVNLGIIGMGNMGSAHFKSVISRKVNHMTVTAVCDINKERLSFVKTNYPDIVTYDDYSALLDNSETDAVLIAVPHPLHSEIALTALKKGKHILVEKPIDITVSAAEKLNAAARKSGKTFGIMFNQRTNSLFHKARELVKSCELGDIKRSVWIITNWYRTQNYYNSGNWRATWLGEGGGVLLNQAPHNLDLWQWICGMPTSVTAFCNVGKFHNIEVEDEATIYTEYTNGATGVFITSTGDCPGTNRLEITGTRGKLILENATLKFWKLKQDERDICKYSDESFVVPETEYLELTAEKELSHIGILQNFANSILFGEELLAPGYEGINELTVSNAAYLSEWSSNKKIILPFDNEEFDRLLSEKIALSSLKESVSLSSKNTEHQKRWQVNW